MHDGFVGTSGGRLLARGLPQRRRREGHDPLALALEPQLEAGAARERQAFEQWSAEVDPVDDLVPGGGPEEVDVNLDVAAQRQCHRVTGEGLGLPQDPPQLGQVPAQAAQRVRGVREE